MDHKPSVRCMYHHQFNTHILRSAHTAVFMCFVWISEQTAIISLYNINWLFFYNRDAVCLLRGTDWIFIYNSG